MHPPPARLGAAEWLLIAALSVLWGGSFVFAKAALAELPPMTLALCRVALAAAALGLGLRIAGIRLPTDAGAWRAFLLMGALNNAVPFSLIFWGQDQISAGLASILNATTPLFTVALAHAIGAERLTPARTAGVTVGLAGVAVLVGPVALAGSGGPPAAQAAVLAGAASYACAGLYGRRFAASPPAVAAAGQLAGATLLMLPLALVVDRPWMLASPRPATMLAVVALALLSTALAYLLYFRVLRTAGATNLLLVTLLIPASAALLGGLLLGETVTGRELAGMALIGCGLAVMDGRPVAALARVAEGCATGRGEWAASRPTGGSAAGASLRPPRPPRGAR